MGLLPILKNSVCNFIFQTFRGLCQEIENIASPSATGLAGAPISCDSMSLQKIAM
jgi:hypothetical protein